MRPEYRLIAALALLTPAAEGRAQWVPGAEQLDVRAVADSQALLKRLTDSSRRAGNDPALRHRIGTIAWALAVRGEFDPKPRDLNRFVMRGLADSSLRLAAQLDPRNPSYKLTLGRFLRSSSDPALRFLATGYFDDAWELARDGRDSALAARTALERGRLAWLQYETSANQFLTNSCDPVIGAPAASIDFYYQHGPRGLLLSMPTQNSGIAFKWLHNDLATCMSAPADAGELDYLTAENFIRDAYARTPNDDRVFRHFAMLLAEKARWVELKSIAGERAVRLGTHAWSWLAYGLAMHRNRESAEAVSAIERGIQLLDSRERARLFALERVLRSRDARVYGAADSARRRMIADSHWLLADPLWTRPGNDARTEFLARVIFAELRWTVEEYGMRGADSDRGEIHIRYGPPDRIMARRGSGTVITYWDYDFGAAFVFVGAATYGTAYFPALDGPHVEYATEVEPAVYDNVERENILNIPLTLARFRAGRDSVDLLALSRIPVTDIRAVTSNAPVRADIWLLGAKAASNVRDSATLSATAVERAVYRVGPELYMYRIEATAEGTMAAGRASRLINAGGDSTSGFATRGFGLSDILFATSSTPAVAAPERWGDYQIAPLFGAIPNGGTLELLWELYEVGERDGVSRYTISVTLQRLRSVGGRIAAAIVGAAASAVGMERRDDRVVFTFDRSRPANPRALVEQVSIAMRDTPAGDYRITLDVTDRVTGRKASSSAVMEVGK